MLLRTPDRISDLEYGSVGRSAPTGDTVLVTIPCGSVGRTAPVTSTSTLVGRDGSVGRAGPGRFAALEELRVGRAGTRTKESTSHPLMCDN